MTKVEALKKLLKFNLFILNDDIKGIDKKLSIEFRGNEFIVLDKDKNVIFKDLLKNYDLDYKGQKKFFKNVASKVASWIKDKDNLICSAIYYIEDVNGDLDELEDLNEIYDLYYLDYDSIIKNEVITLYFR